MEFNPVEKTMIKRDAPIILFSLLLILPICACTKADFPTGAFGTEAGNSVLVFDKNGGFAFLKVDGRKPPEPNPLTEMNLSGKQIDIASSWVKRPIHGLMKTACPPCN